MPTSTGEGLERRYALIALGAAAAASVALVAALTHDWVLNFDDLVFFLHARGFDLGNLLEPHGGHIVFIPRILFAGALEGFGPDNYLVFSLMLRAFVLAKVLLIFLLLRRRIRSFAALAPCLVLLFMGAAWTSTLGPGSLAGAICSTAGLGALLALDENVDDRRRQAVASSLLVLAMVSFTGALVYVAAVAVRMAIEPGRRVPRIWVVALPVIVYLPWYLLQDPTSDQGAETSIVGLLSIVEIAAVSLSAAIGGILGFAYDPSAAAEVRVWIGAPFALLAVAGFAWRAARGPLPPTTWAFLTLLVANWGLLALAQSDERQPDDPRHLFFPAFVVVLIAADLLRDVRISARALAAVYAVTAVSLTANVAMLVHRGEYLSEYSETLRAEMSAIELSCPRVPDDFVPAEHGGVLAVPAGPYLDAVERFGSPVSAGPDLAASEPELRAHARRLVAEAAGSGARCP